MDQVILNQHWVCLHFGGSLNLNLISVYAPCNHKGRAEVWQELAALQGNSILCGDFNMVEIIEDRYLGAGTVLHGKEQETWEDMTNVLDLADVSSSTGFTWSNKQSGSCFRAARLDHFYVSMDLQDMWADISCKTDKTINISDHYSLIFKASSTSDKTRSGWFHSDPALFSFLEVQNDVESIVSTAFQSHSHPAQAWSDAISKI